MQGLAVVSTKKKYRRVASSLASELDEAAAYDAEVDKAANDDDDDSQRACSGVVALGLGAVAVCVIIAVALRVGPAHTLPHDAMLFDRCADAAQEARVQSLGQPAPPALRPFSTTRKCSAPWLRRHTEQMRNASALLSRLGEREQPVAFTGDSITEGIVRVGFSERFANSMRQPRNEEIWKSFFPGPILNFGVGGDRVQDLGWRMQHGILSLDFSPRAVVVAIGTNDLGSGEDPDVVADEIKELVELIYATKRAPVVLSAILPRGADEGTRGSDSFHRSAWWYTPWNPHRASIERVNAALHSLEGPSRAWLTVVDCGDLFVQDAYSPESQVDLGAAPGPKYIKTELMYDMLHLTPEGYRAWAGCLKPHVRNAVIRAGGGRRGTTQG